MLINLIQNIKMLVTWSWLIIERFTFLAFFRPGSHGSLPIPKKIRQKTMDKPQTNLPKEKNEAPRRCEPWFLEPEILVTPVDTEGVNDAFVCKDDQRWSNMTNLYQGIHRWFVCFVFARSLPVCVLLEIWESCHSVHRSSLCYEFFIFSCLCMAVWHQTKWSRQMTPWLKIL